VSPIIQCFVVGSICGVTPSVPFEPAAPGCPSLPSLPSCPFCPCKDANHSTSVPLNPLSYAI